MLACTGSTDLFFSTVRVHWYIFQHSNITKTLFNTSQPCRVSPRRHCMLLGCLPALHWLLSAVPPLRHVQRCMQRLPRTLYTSNSVQQTAAAATAACLLACVTPLCPAYIACHTDCTPLS